MSFMRYSCLKKSWGNEVRRARLSWHGTKAENRTREIEWSNIEKFLNLKRVKRKSKGQLNGLWKWKRRSHCTNSGNLKRRYWRSNALSKKRMDLRIHAIEWNETTSWHQEILWKIWCWGSPHTRRRSSQEIIRWRRWKG